MCKMENLCAIAKDTAMFFRLRFPLFLKNYCRIRAFIMDNIKKILVIQKFSIVKPKFNQRQILT